MLYDAFFIYESLDQTWGLHVDYGVLLAACFVVFLTLSKKKDGPVNQKK